jgi:hypothetical protein
MHYRSIVGFSILIGVLLSLGVSSSPAVNFEKAQSDRDEQWSEDLDQLYEFLQQRHPNAFYVNPQEDFDEIILDLHSRIPSLTDDQMILEFQRIVALIRDAHSQVQFTPGATGFRIYPLRLYLFSDGLYVIDALDPYTDAIGARVVSIEDAPIDDVYNALVPLISAENEFWPKLIIPFRIRTPEILHALGFAESPDRAEWHFENSSGEVFSINISAHELSSIPGVFTAAPPLIDHSEDAPLYLEDNDENFWMRYLEAENTLYIQYNSVQFQTESGAVMSSFSQSIRTFIAGQEVDKVIVDMRHNGGGDNGTYPHFLNLLTGDPRINEAGKLFVLIGRNTFSAAVNFAAEVEFQSEATFVGEPTGNRPHLYGDCQVSRLTHSQLPICLSTRFWTRGTPDDDRLAIPPDIAIELSSEDYFSRLDPALDLILNSNE